MSMNSLRRFLIEQLKAAEPLDRPSSMADPRAVAVEAAKRVGLLGLGQVYPVALGVETAQDCAAVLIDCLALLPSEGPDMGSGELLTIDQAAEYLGYQASGLRKLVDQKRIKYLQNGRGPLKFRAEWLDEYIETNVTGLDDIERSPARPYAPTPEPVFGFDPSLLS